LDRGDDSVTSLDSERPLSATRPISIRSGGGGSGGDAGWVGQVVGDGAEEKEETVDVPEGWETAVAMATSEIPRTASATNQIDRTASATNQIASMAAAAAGTNHIALVAAAEAAGATLVTCRATAGGHEIGDP
jgi:hypothetical protein